MANLTSDLLIDERLGKRFGYKVRGNATAKRGSLLGVTATGLLDKAGTSGIVAIVGVSPKAFDNTGGADGAFLIEPRRGVLHLAVGSATHAHINASVYQTADDATLTLTASGNLLAGKIVGFSEAGVPAVEF